MVCVPFILHFAACIYFFSSYLTADPEGETFMKIMTRVPIYLGALYFQWFEVLQYRATSGIYSYIISLQNVLETASFVLNMTLMIKYDFFYSFWYTIETQQIMASLAVGLMWYRAFTWMRIFEATAFFLRLLKMTLLDVRSFSIMMFVIITAFANILYILDA